MINVKEEVYEALLQVTENVSDSYPSNWVDFPAIQYTEEDNRMYEVTDEHEDKSYVRYRIDIWHNQSTSSAALMVDELLSSKGLKRVLCQDANDPGALKHKVMRYEGIIDTETLYVYQE